MSFVWILYVTAPLAAMALNAVLAVWIHTKHRDVRGARWFVVSLVLGALWMALFVAALLATDRSLQVTLFVLSDKAFVASIATWLLFASLYSRTEFHRHPLGAAAFVVLFATLPVPTFVDPFYSAWYEYAVTYASPVHYVHLEPNLPVVVVGSLMGVLSIVAVVSLAVYHLGTPRASGTKMALLATAALPIPACLALGMAGVFPATALNHAAYGLLPFNLLMAVALFRFRLFEVQPVARTAVVKYLQDPVFVFDDERRLTDYNEAGARLFPAVEESVAAEFEAVLPDLAGAVELPEAGETVSTHLPIEVDGDRRYFSATVARIGGTRYGPADWYSVVLRDVTDLERSRWQLARQNERLDQVASTISHDLRNPINVADGHAELLDDRLAAADVDSDPSAEMREHVAKIRTSHERMLTIIDDVLSIAREGKTVEDAAPVDLASVAEEAWRNVETGEATLSIVDDATLRADRSKLLTILENLFRNAIDHCQPDVAVEVGATDGGFYVADDGPGIPEASRDRVFEYGYTTGSDGSGLGLPIVQTMAESHGWTVAIDESADGARFVVSTEIVGEETAVG